MLNLAIFKVGEIVQALDATTSIWEEAKVLGHESDWSVRITWIHWGSRKPVVFTLTEDLREQSVENWSIRKKQVILTSTSGRRLRTSTQTGTAITGPHKAFSGQTRKITHYDEVSYIHTSDNSVICEPGNMRLYYILLPVENM